MYVCVSLMHFRLRETYGRKESKDRVNNHAHGNLDLVGAPLTPRIDLGLLKEGTSEKVLSGSVRGHESGNSVGLEKRSLRRHKNGNLSERRNLKKLWAFLRYSSLGMCCVDKVNSCVVLTW